MKGGRLIHSQCRDLSHIHVYAAPMIAVYSSPEAEGTAQRSSDEA